MNTNETPRKESSKTDDHLAAIRNGFKLKPVTERVVEPKIPISPPSGGGLDDVLKQALVKFKDANEMSDEENDDGGDSSGWSSEEE